MNRKVKALQVLSILLFSCWLFWPGSRGEADEEEEGRSISPPPSEQTPGVVKLTKAAQEKGGIVVSPLKSTLHRRELQAWGMILELDNFMETRKSFVGSQKNLIALRNNYSSARARMQERRAFLHASRDQYERLKTLYEDDRNVSFRDFQAAEATWRSDQASMQAAREAVQAAEDILRAAEEEMRVLTDTARQQWGDVLTKRLIEGSAGFERLARQQEILIQLSLPYGELISPAPETIRVQTASGSFVTAGFVSLSPRVNPRIQGVTYFYTASARGDLLPGMQVIGFFPSGPKRRGVFIPGSAVIWWQGHAWTYVQQGEENFVRRILPTGTPRQKGYFAAEGFKAGEKIVVKGAQLLLSKEFRLQIQGGGD
jgi:multidrug efflux pump subunit AcrA (membrane-fusion protein)